MTLRHAPQVLDSVLAVDDGRVLSLVETDTSEARKARGAFFTPEPVARFITDWAVRAVDDEVLEPSCGEAAFLVQAVHRLRDLQPVRSVQRPRVAGVEIHALSAQAARREVFAAGGAPEVITEDFFVTEPSASYSAVIGNPPYIRFHDFVGESRTRSREAALRAGVSLSSLASSWAAFTVHSALFLRPGGRLGLVLPAELLSVNYAAPVRRFLFERFARLELVMFTERVFPDAQADVVLLLADGYEQGPAQHASIYQARNAEGLSEMAAATIWKPQDPADKWTPSLLSAGALAAYSSLLHDASFVPLLDWGDTTLGMVSGNNKFFALSPARATELGLAKTELLRLSPPGSAHLRGLALSDRALRELGQSGASTWLFRPSGSPSAAALAYIASGEEAGVHQAYKCRVRSPWWRVPLVKPADLLLTYMNADTPRLTTNEAKAHHLNSIHGVYLKPEMRDLGMRFLPLAALTSMTLLGAETVGRAYGGGILKLEPKEADTLPVPTSALIESERDRLTAVKPQMARLLRGKKLTDAAKLMDDVLLVGGLGMRRGDVKDLRDAHADLTARRTARGRGVSTH